MEKTIPSPCGRYCPPPSQFYWLGNTCICVVTLSVEKRKKVTFKREKRLKKILRRGGNELPVSGHAGVQESKKQQGFSHHAAEMRVTQPRTQDQVV